MYAGRVIKLDPRVVGVSFPDPETMRFDLADGRALLVPLSWSYRLSKAPPEVRRNWRVSGDGTVVHWPGADEDIHVPSLLGSGQVVDWPDPLPTER